MPNVAIAPKSGSTGTSGNGQNYRGPFAIMTVLFFMWGFMTVWNDILIPRFKEAYNVTESETFRTMTIQATGGTRKTVEAGLDHATYAPDDEPLGAAQLGAGDMARRQDRRWIADLGHESLSP